MADDQVTKDELLGTLQKFRQRGDTHWAKLDHYATLDSAGLIRPDGVTIKVDEEGMATAIGSGSTATTSKPGIVKPDGTTITVDGDGTIHGASTLRPDGTTITIAQDGTLAAAPATDSTLGVAMVPGGNGLSLSDGAITMQQATSYQYGTVMPDGVTTYIEGGRLMAAGGGGEAFPAGRVGYMGNRNYMPSVAYIFGNEMDLAYRFPLVESVPDYGFYGTRNIRSVLFPVCYSIGSQAFYMCSDLTSAYFPVCNVVEDHAFCDCKYLSDLSIPRCVSVGSFAFFRCYYLSSVDMPMCQYLGEGAFDMCSRLETASMPTCSYVGEDAFMRCSSLRNVSITSCKQVGSRAFYNCRSLRTLSLPSCEAIGAGAFSSCVLLTKLDLTGASMVPALGDDAFNTTPIAGYNGETMTPGSVYVPSSLYSDFLTAYNWSLVSSRIVSV